jgi:hypothetical protein
MGFAFVSEYFMCYIEAKTEQQGTRNWSIDVSPWVSPGNMRGRCEKKHQGYGQPQGIL